MAKKNKSKKMFIPTRAIDESEEKVTKIKEEKNMHDAFNDEKWEDPVEYIEENVSLKETPNEKDNPDEIKNEETGIYDLNVEGVGDTPSLVDEKGEGSDEIKETEFGIGINDSIINEELSDNSMPSLTSDKKGDKEESKLSVNTPIIQSSDSSGEVPSEIKEVNVMMNEMNLEPKKNECIEINLSDVSIEGVIDLPSPEEAIMVENMPQSMIDKLPSQTTSDITPEIASEPEETLRQVNQQPPNRPLGNPINLIKRIFCGNSFSTTLKFKESIFSEDKAFKNIYLQTKDGLIIGAWLVSPKVRNEYTRYAILCHGNGCNRRSFCEGFEIERIVNLNFCLLIPDYREFADSQGVFTPEGVNYDIERCVDYMEKTFHPPQIHMIGFSLGTAIILNYIKYKNNPRHGKIVLIGAFTRSIDLLNEYKIWRLVSKLNPFIYKKLKESIDFDSISNIKCIDKEDIILIHGKEDDVVPFDQGLALANEVGCKIYRSRGDNHLTIMVNPEVWAIVNSFLKAEK
ncbi:Protein ABHD12B [Astathelohania contejeani]|uniref:Protein ABHD12B n=1 Tax=Astathelohania contejeani TaxID=164912 RepID=A0ABQ7HYG5_9MICR|nr:Protein ABHD12B [Thelohania contejeani]